VINFFFSFNVSFSVVEISGSFKEMELIILGASGCGIFI